MLQNGIYHIFANLGHYSYLALDVPGGKKDDGVIIQQFGFHGKPNQQWEINRLANGFYTIVNVETKKALDVPNGFKTPGLAVQQFKFHGGPNQQWRFETFPAVNGPELFRPEFHRIYNSQSTLALDVPNGSQAYRQTIQQYTPNGGWNQTWVLTKKV